MNLRISKKSPAVMSAREINRELGKLSEIQSRQSQQMIHDGRGLERFTDWQAKTDPLSVAMMAVWRRRLELRSEVERRAGPVHRLPTGRGFGPLNTRS